MVDKDFTTVTEVPGVKISRGELSHIQTRYQWAGEALSKNASVLEVACGSGPGLGYLRACGADRVVGTDIEEANLAFARSHYEGRDGIECQVVDACAMPFDDASFDFVLNFEAIYYMDLMSAYRESLRVLKPGGKLLISTVNPEVSGFNASPFSLTYPTHDQLRRDLVNAGFNSASVMGGFPVANGASAQVKTAIKRMAVALRLIPRTMKGKEFFKHLFYGSLVEMPSELTQDGFPVGQMTALQAGDDASNYTFLYAQAEK